MLAEVQFLFRLLGYFVLLLLFVVGVLIAIQATRIHQQTIPGIPWVGLNDRKIFPKLRACLGELGAGRTMIEEGWQKYGKNRKPFVVPGLHWNAVVLPPHLASWVARQPDSILSGFTPMSDALGAEYLAHGPDVKSVLDFTVLRRDLTRQILRLNEETWDEIIHALDEHLDLKSEDWTDVGVKGVIEGIVFSVTNRLFVGLPLCRSKPYKKAVTQWTTFFGIAVLFCRYLVPGPAKPLVMRIIALPANLLRWRATAYLVPQVEKRLLRPPQNAARQAGVKKQNDMMQWIIDHNSQKSNPAELAPSNIAGKMILLNLFAFGTTSVIGTVVLIDILSHRDASTVLAELREEAERVIPMLEEDPASVRSMVKMDSVIRETLRVHPLNEQGTIREVLPPGGVVTPDGLHLPQGTHVSTIANSMQNDSDFWGEGADAYDPLRFYKQAGANGIGSRQTSAVQLSEDYLSFGLGKHACPGRFFAVHAIKLILGYLLVQYDFEPLQERPDFIVFAEALIPKDETKIRVRRRRTEV